MPTESPAGDLDLHAFMDGQLDDAARRGALNRLAHDPEAAARVMGDMAIGHALRTAAGADPARPSAVLERSARRLQRSLAVRPYAKWAARAAASAAVFLAGYALGEADVRPTPADAPPFVAEALMAHRTALIRARMASQPETPRFDAAEIRVATKIALPPLPADWRVTDAQVYPSDEGPSIGLSFATPSGSVALFAFRTDAQRQIAPTTLREGPQRVAYWQEGDLAFALIGPMPARRLEAIAGRMARADLPGHAS
jgi:anti-sigma factor RsiW